METRKNSNKIGKNFEDRLNDKFIKYKRENIAYISKVPTEFVIIRNKQGNIATAFPRGKSQFLDYIGVLKNGKTIVLEAKSTSNKTSFPLSMIKEYQYTLIEEFLKYTDYVYMIVEFREKNEVYMFKANQVLTFEKTYGRKSIPYNWFKENAILLNNLNILDFIE